jgi:hypothetical protein
MQQRGASPSLAIACEFSSNSYNKVESSWATNSTPCSHSIYTGSSGRENKMVIVTQLLPEESRKRWGGGWKGSFCLEVRNVLTHMVTGSNPPCCLAATVFVA